MLRFILVDWGRQPRCLQINALFSPLHRPIISCAPGQCFEELEETVTKHWPMSTMPAATMSVRIAPGKARFTAVITLQLVNQASSAHVILVTSRVVSEGG